MSLYARIILDEAKKIVGKKKRKASKKLSRRALRTKPKAGAEIPEEALKKNKKPPGVLWKDWFHARKAYEKKKPGAPIKKATKQKKTTPITKLVKDEIRKWASARKYVRQKNWLDVLAQSIKKGKAPAVADWLRTAPGNWKQLKQKGLDYFTKDSLSKLQSLLPDAAAADDWAGTHQQMGWWGVGGKKQKSKALSTKGLPRPQLTAEEKKLKKLRHSVGTLERPAAGGVVFKSFTAPDVWDMLVLVSQVHPKFGSYWVFPKGGVDIGESLHQGAVREVREEAGVKAKVVPGTPYVHTSRFGDRGSFDLTLVMDALLKKNRSEAAFIKAHEQDFAKGHFSFKNTSHYYVMQHVSGRPRNRPGGDQEMNRSEWVTLREAASRSSRMKKVIKGLMPQIRRLWVPGDAPGKTTLADLAGSRRAG